jgi:hypothetical protein
MRYIWLCLLLTSIAGCVSTPSINTDAISVQTFAPEVRQVTIDSALLEKCKSIEDTLANGTEDEVIRWAKSVLSEASTCAKRNNKVVDWIKDTYKIEQ